MLHQPRLARRSQLPPQAGAWFSNSLLEFSSMRSGELLHTGTAVSTPERASSLPRRTAPPVSAVAAPPVPAAAPCRQRQKPGVWRATSRWPASPCLPPSSRRSRTREAAALGCHEGHHGRDTGVHSRCLAGSFCCEDLRRPRMGSTEAEKPPSTIILGTSQPYQLGSGEASRPSH